MKKLLIVFCLMMAPALLLAQRDTRGSGAPPTIAPASNPFDVAVNYSPVGDDFVLLTIAVRGGVAPYTAHWQLRPGGISGTIAPAPMAWWVAPAPPGDSEYVVTVTDALGNVTQRALTIYANRSGR